MVKSWNDYGESSLTIVSAALGITKDKPATPSDYGDFVRCIHLLECMDQHLIANDLIEKTAEKYPIWKPFYQNWAKLIALYKDESKIEPKYYRFWNDDDDEYYETTKIRCYWNESVDNLIKKLNDVKRD